MAKYTKRRDKRGYEWKSAYREKEALMLERGYPEVSPHDFYRELFPAGSLQQEPEDGKGNIIATQIRPSGKGRTRQWVIDDSLKMLDKVIGDRFGLIPPISFYGKSHTKENAHELFAVVVDVDYVGKQQLKNLLKQFGNGVQLRPTYLVSSGKGVHLYYFLQEPVQLYRNREEVLAELKEAFIRRLWNDTSSIRPDSPDITGIYQGFRCVGSQSKLGVDFPVKAYKLSENRYTLEDIKASIPSCKVDLAPLYEKPRRKSTVTLEEAKELYPECERQGNQNPLVHVYRYVTEGTFDAYLWQTVENKQKFISQIMTSKSPVRSCDDVDETALSFAEIKALCAGDPRIKERMDLDVEVSRLKLMKADHQSKQYRLEDQLLKYFPEEIEKHKGFIKGFESDLEVLAAHPHPEDGFAGMEIRGDLLTDKENAGAALLDACKEVKTSDPVQIGSYRGYAMSVEFSAWKQEYTLLLKGQMTHRHFEKFF